MAQITHMNSSIVTLPSGKYKNAVTYITVVNNVKTATNSIKMASVNK